MEIFIIKTDMLQNVDENLLKKFKQKEISIAKKQQIHCLAYYLVDKLLKENYKIENRKILFQNKKPIIINNQKHFSISHSNEYIALAFSDDNCGIDIEKIKNRDFKSIAQRMNFSVNNLEDFYKEWTKFEAEYKLQASTKSIKNFNYNNYSITATSTNSEENFQIFFLNGNNFSKLKI